MCAFIEEHRDEHGVEPICRELQVAPSTYYGHRSRPASARNRSDEELLVEIRTIHEENYGVYGARRVHAELRRQGRQVARCTVERLMRADGLRGLSRAKGLRTTKPPASRNHRLPTMPDAPTALPACSLEAPFAISTQNSRSTS